MSDSGDIAGLVVTRIRKLQGGRVSIFAGRRRIAALAARDASALGIAEGTEITPGLAREIRGADELGRAREAAHRLLARRALSSSKIRDALRKREFDAGVISRVIEELTLTGVLDDQAASAAMARGLVDRKPVARVMIEAKLRSRGFSRDDAGAAAREATAGRDELEDAVELARKRLSRRSGRGDREKEARALHGFLARRGFDMGVCRRAVQRVMRERDADGHDEGAE